MKASWRYTVLGLTTVLTGLVLGYSGPDLPPGPYCGTYPQLCCTDRRDDCSVPILGTLCYCDEFCNRTRDDCCPDYQEVCLGIASPIIKKECRYNDEIIPLKGKRKENCNECECVARNIPGTDEKQVEMSCERDTCIVDSSLIEEINYDSRSTWRARRHEPFWGHKLQEGILLRLGTLDPQKSTARMYPIRPIYDHNDIPRDFNALNKWPNEISSVKDQGWCGSSWAISTADVASDKFAISSNRIEMPRLSAQQFLSCNTKGQRSCNGGYLDRAWQYIRKVGLVDDDCLPYSAKVETCRIPIRDLSLVSSGCELPESPSTRTGRYLVAPPFLLGNEMDIMHEIYTSGPVQATMKVHHDFFSYSGGIYQKSQYVKSNNFGYHSVRITGWGEENGAKYWLVANSWGENWGENGYFRILRGKNECDIEKFVLSTLAYTVDNSAGVPG